MLVQYPEDSSQQSAFLSIARRESFSTDGFRWTEGDIDLLFKLDISAEIGNADTKRTILNSVESQIRKFAEGFAEDLKTNGAKLLDAKVRDKPLLNFDNHKNLFPWLPWPDRKIVFRPAAELEELPKRAFYPDAPLVNQAKAELNLKIGDILVVSTAPSAQASPLTRGTLPQVEFTLATFELISLEFERGSMFSSVSLRIKSLVAGAIVALGVSLGSAEASKAIGMIEAHHQYQVRVAEATKGQPAMQFCGSRLSLDYLEHVRDRSLNYNEPGISPEEKACRIAEEQVLLKVALNTDLAVDGKVGPETIASESEYGHEKSVPGTNRSPFFRGKLSKEL